MRHYILFSEGVSLILVGDLENFFEYKDKRSIHHRVWAYFLIRSTGVEFCLFYIRAIQSLQQDKRIDSALSVFVNLPNSGSLVLNDMRMKNKVFNISAVVMAFCIGVAINYSCGDNYPIEGIAGGSSSSPNGILVDGIWFINGPTSGRVREQTTLSYLNEQLYSSNTTKYEYDDYGRMIGIYYSDNDLYYK